MWRHSFQAWARELRELVFYLDADEAGQKKRQEMSRAAAMRGKRVSYLPPEALGGHKDLSAAWGADALRLDLSPGPLDIWGEVAAWPPERREAWEEKAAILEYESKMDRLMRSGPPVRGCGAACGGRET